MHQERSKEYEKRKSWSHVEQRAALLEWYNVTGTAKTKVRETTRSMVYKRQIFQIILRALGRQVQNTRKIVRFTA